MKLFIVDLNVDTAILRLTDTTRKGNFFPTGFSATIGAYIEGDIDETEQVIMDFSKLKSLLKSKIDSSIDHGCIVVHDNTTKLQDFSDIVSKHMSHNFYLKFTYVEDPNLSAKEATSQQRGLTDTEIVNICLNRLSDSLKQEYNLVVTFEVMQPSFIVPFNNSVYLGFNYCHGLPNSSSKPCQFPLHGHSSTVCVKPNFMVNEDLIKLALSNVINSKVFFVNKAHFHTDKQINENTSYDSSYLHNVESWYSYKPKDFPDFSFFMTFTEETDYKVCVLDKDTTIENIVEYVADKLAQVLLLKGFKDETFEIYISEGLKKGCMTSRKI